MQKDKYKVYEFNIRVISNTLQNSPKFSISGCKSELIYAHLHKLHVNW